MPDRVYRKQLESSLAGHPYSYSSVSGDEAGLWFATTPEAVAELRERIAEVLEAHRMAIIRAYDGMSPLHLNAPTLDQGTDAVLRALGFQDGE